MIRTVALVLLAGLLAPAACGRPPRRALPSVSGRVEAPSGIDVTGLRVVACGERRRRWRLGYVHGDGAFRVELAGVDEAHVDLQVARLPTTALNLPSGRLPTLEDLEAAIDAAPPPRPDPGTGDSTYRVGDHEGIVRHVEVGRDDVVIRLVPRVTEPLVLEVREPDGSPAVGVGVSLHSMADRLGGTTDATGRVAWRDVPVRGWTAVVRRPDEVVGLEQLVVPQKEPIAVRLRSPWSVYVRCAARLPEGARLLVGRAGSHVHYGPIAWEPDAEGRVRLRVDPGVAALCLFLEVPSGPRTADVIGCQTLTCRPDAEATIPLCSCRFD